MSVRKIAGLLAGFALAVGLIGAGVSASFTDSVTAKENINVGTFSCGISAATDGATFGAIDTLGYAHSVSYTAPKIESSDAGSAPFSFTVQNTGSIPDVLTVATSPVSAPWSIIGAPFAPVALAAGASHPYNTGVSWTELGNGDLNAHGTVTWTVSCNEDHSTVAFSSDTVLDGYHLLPTHESGTGFAAGPVQVSFSYAWGTKSYVYNGVATANALGNFSWNGQENCYDQEVYLGGVLVTTDQTVIVTATDGGHFATGTGILHCGLYAPPQI
jgi:predicted ribosomally synthesized peptide with SipW-like signal peptide